MYKGFNRDMTCKNFHYQIGEEYREESAKLCEHGFHACELPHHVFAYYSPGDSKFCEVELDATPEINSDDSKRVGTHIKIGAELSAAQLARISVNAFF